MRLFRWNEEKAKALRNDKNRGRVGFEDCVVAIEEGRLLAILPNPARPDQRMFVVEVQSYAYVVPFVEDEDSIFLKTVYPSRKHTAAYLGN